VASGWEALPVHAAWRNALAPRMRCSAPPFPTGWSAPGPGRFNPSGSSSTAVLPAANRWAQAGDRDRGGHGRPGAPRPLRARGRCLLRMGSALGVTSVATWQGELPCLIASLPPCLRRA
jgi:hypothetical protein